MAHAGEISDEIKVWGKKWSDRMRIQNDLDMFTAIAWGEARNFWPWDPEHRDRLMWRLCNCDLDIIEGAEDIAIISKFCYVGRSGSPVLRMFGKDAGLSPTSTMIPHKDNYQHMVVLSADWPDALAERESYIISYMDRNIGSMSGAGEMLNRTFGNDGPMVGPVQFLYIVFTCKPGLDGVVKVKYGHQLPDEIDPDFIANHAKLHD